MLELGRQIRRPILPRSKGHSFCDCNELGLAPWQEMAMKKSRAEIVYKVGRNRFSIRAAALEALRDTVTKYPLSIWLHNFIEANGRSPVLVEVQKKLNELSARAARRITKFPGE